MKAKSDSKTPASTPPPTNPSTKKENRGGSRISLKPKCGNIARGTGKPCRREAGWGTDHVGSGKCKLHGGCNPIKHGFYSTVIPPEYREKYEEFRKAPNMNSLMDELAYLRIVLMRLEKKHGSNPDGTEKSAIMLGELMMEPLEMIGECIEKISRVVKRKNDIEEGTKITFSMTDLKEFSEAMMQAVIKHVSHPDTIAAIRGELAAYFAGQASPASV